eukprot:CAMPEP_0198134480 /NCGR_PEP_ID=MMETSP1442-20131203/60099_1 /TAXON_ID= /ORGANISM="Craspedostauros australis, Strain CCMP3328" /LENGTH=367 /DNA_ID=CAMNT_0043795625 /DNA_START=765 /DNA_END=1865 /DNA_ORIENTATION=+
MMNEDSRKPGTIEDGSVNVANSDATSAHSSYDEPKVDEVQEIRDVARRDTRSVRCWRWIVTGALLATAVALSLTTYKLLDNEQTSIMEATYRSVTQSLEDNALGHVGRLQLACKTLADSMSIYVESTNQTWPFVTMPSFQTHVDNFLQMSQMEFIGAFHRVEPGDEEEEWEKYASERYEKMVEDWHVGRYGNTNRLKPVGYNPDVYSIDPTLSPDRPGSRFPSWEFGPPPFTYGLINRDMATRPDRIVNALLRLRNQTIMTGALDISRLIQIVMTEEEHAEYHSRLRASKTDHPHSFVFHPVHQHASDPTSRIVGLLSGAVSLDAPLRNLLPTNMKGIIAVIKNTCGQTFTYIIDGHDALYQGEGEC